MVVGWPKFKSLKIRIFLGDRLESSKLRVGCGGLELTSLLFCEDSSANFVLAKFASSKIDFLVSAIMLPLRWETKDINLSRISIVVVYISREKIYREKKPIFAAVESMEATAYLSYRLLPCLCISPADAVHGAVCVMCL